MTDKPETYYYWLSWSFSDATYALATWHMGVIVAQWRAGQ